LLSQNFTLKLYILLIWKQKINEQNKLSLNSTMRSSSLQMPQMPIGIPPSMLYLPFVDGIVNANNTINESQVSKLFILIIAGL